MGAKDRSLEVVILAGRGLSSAVPIGGRRKVQITLPSSKDPGGEAFGAKVSPWTEVVGSGKELRFGASGLRCSFPISGRRGAPSLTADPHFADTAVLRIRLLASQISVQSAAARTAEIFLPKAVMDFASQEIDEATAQLEAEVKVPLANILSGRVGHAADRALGGWVPLRSCLDEEDGLPAEDDLPPALWMQMYVLPDHEAMLPKLQAQLNEENSRQPKSAAAPAQQPHARTAPQARTSAGPQQAAGGQTAQASAPPRWGPPKGAAAPTQTVNDLIDVTLDDPQESPNLLDDLIDTGDAGLGGLGGLTFVDQDLPHIGTAPASAGNLPVASGFSFVNNSPAGYSAPEPAPAPQPDFLAPSPALPAGGPSAFGFIAASGASAGNAQGAKLDLAALYASSEPPKANSLQASSAKFAELASMTDPVAKQPAGSEFASLEQSMLADLKL